VTDEEKLKQLQPDFAALIVKLMAAVKARGFELMITQALRTFEEQNALYAKGRTKPGPKVTNAKGGESYHNYGAAVDLCLKEKVNGSHFPDKHPVWNVIGEEAEKLGLEWGGRWKSMPDRPHVQAPVTLANLKKWHTKGDRAEVWANVAKALEPELKTEDVAA